MLTIHIPYWTCCLCSGVLFVALLIVSHMIAWAVGNDAGVQDALEQCELPLTDQDPWFQRAVRDFNNKVR